MITDLGHAAFACADLERALAFYAKLGIREAFRLNREDGSLMLVYLHVAGDRFIEVFPASGPLVTGQPISYMHLCLVVDDVKAMAEQLRSDGIAIERGPS
ncbi:MAG: VOC family protein, partial [Thermoflexales bacterium]|nr:VOC family protein [Thermoflexales bacterium]